jgi:hypothetical protein
VVIYIAPVGVRGIQSVGSSSIAIDAAAADAYFTQVSARIVAAEANATNALVGLRAEAALAQQSAVAAELEAAHSLQLASKAMGWAAKEARRQACIEMMEAESYWAYYRFIMSLL